MAVGVQKGESERLERVRRRADQPAVPLRLAQLADQLRRHGGGPVKGEGVHGLGHERREALAQHALREGEQRRGHDLQGGGGGWQVKSGVG